MVTRLPSFFTSTDSKVNSVIDPDHHGADLEALAVAVLTPHVAVPEVGTTIDVATAGLDRLCLADQGAIQARTIVGVEDPPRLVHSKNEPRPRSR